MRADPMGFRTMRCLFQAMPELEPCGVLTDEQAASLHEALAVSLDEQLIDPDLRRGLAEELDARLAALVQWATTRGVHDRC